MKRIPILSISLALLGLAHAAPKVEVRCETAHPAILVSEKKQTTYVKVSLTGFERSSRSERGPVNIAFVLDRSGSMTGAKLESAKQAARLAVSRLRADDIFSIITYDSTVDVVVPATKVTDGRAILKAIDRIEAGGNTALFGGVAKGAGEVRKFLRADHVNAIILLSDGMANVGPSSPDELGDLGRSLIKEGISVTTLGLGLDYNEDLMGKLADTSDGVHRFIQEPAQLVAFFETEFGNVMEVVAQQIDITIECAPAVRPIRVIGREAEILGQTVRLRMNQIYSDQEKYLLLEVEAPGGTVGAEQDLVAVDVSYQNLATGDADHERKAVACRYVATEAEAIQNDDVMFAAVAQIATETNRAAVTLRDAGKVQEAKELLTRNVEYLESQEPSIKAKRGFGKITGINLIDRELIDKDENWSARRKTMRAQQSELSQSQLALPLPASKPPKPKAP